MGLSTATKRIKILRGEGIECENELARMLTQLGHHCEFWDLPRLLQNPEQTLNELQKGDWVFLPGGFSFADHMGSGRLLAFELNEIKFFEKVFLKEANLWGICNGFQVLVASGVFGDVELKHNEFQGRPSQFEDKWVKLYSPILREEYFYPARHGEGCLKVNRLAPNTETFIRYLEGWSNGSDEDIAGLIRQVGKSTVIGLMPHGEILNRPEQSPDYDLTQQNPFNPKGIFKILDTERSSL